EYESIVPTAHPEDPDLFLTGWAELFVCRMSDLENNRLVKNHYFRSKGTPQYSIDGNMLAIRSNSFEFLFLDPGSFESVAKIQTVGNSRLTEFDFSSDGRHVAIACFDNLQIMNLERTRKELEELGLGW
ncbi:MAG: hypothetical protein AAF456_23735, partial [Planctomycetota bacterium]